MLTFTLTRNKQTPDGTFGRLNGPGIKHDGGLFTMEDDWRDNQVGKSCIPAGTYQIKRSFLHPGSPKGYECFEVMDVEGRSLIKIHIANYEEQVEGCIAPGLGLDKFLVARDEDTGEANKLKLGVTHSRVGFQKFMAALEGENVAMLVVQWAHGLPKPQQELQLV